jgi:hypothetical protein
MRPHVNGKSQDETGPQILFIISMSRLRLKDDEYKL